ncbi:TonB-dependent receptor domain-containing protein [Hirschia maritima]|uniref:TonB-dependent receptor domain-containing protein n=1 Tax=Hirschia maritima TaxID=1121961 RepID=UPI00037428CF|nr:TonB-dependent receptor [Hirschia maritima]
MNIKNLKSGLVRSTILAGLAAVSAPAVLAQDVDTVAEAAEDTSVQQTIVVTGTRIPQQNLVGQSPVTAIGAGEITARGVVRVEDVINTLPQAFAAQGSNISNGSTGTATVNLRGLGSSRTLVLMNGRRMPYGSPATGGAAADLNQIPAALVERVDVLTGGASAVYGSDAIAGVVNFIMKDDFEGLRIDTNYSFYQHDNGNTLMHEINEARGFPASKGNVTDGNAFDITAILGINSDDGNGNLTAYGSYRKVDPVLQADRDYANCALTGAGTDASPYGCGGSSTNSTANLLNLGSLDLPLWFSVDDNNTFTDDRSGFFNYNPFNYFQRPDERYSFGVNGHYEFNKNVEVYTEMSFMYNRTFAQIAPSGVFGGGIAGDAGGINCNNAFLSAQQVDYLCTSVGLGPDDVAEDVLILRRNVEGGNRTDDLTHETFRMLGGVKGEIADTGLQYDVFASFSRVNLSNSYLNELSKAKVAKALNAVDDGNGNIVCAVNADDISSNDDALCVPYDIFSNAGPSDAALAYVVSPLVAVGNTDAQNIVGTIAGDLGQHGIKIPSASEGVGFVVGAEYRRNSLAFQPDAAFLSGDGFGQGGPTNPISGSTESYEFFGELAVPLVQDKPGIYDLGLEFAYRHANFTTPDKKTNTYKVGFDYAPVEDIRFRASFQKAARTANIFELYASQSIGLFDLTEQTGVDGAYYDPCSGANPAASAAACANTGVTAAQYGNVADNPAGQFNQLTGGNLDLDPEESETFTVGFVFEPSFVDGLSVTVDYFDITVEDYISTVNPETALNECLDTGDAFFCSLVNRGSGGTLWAGQTGFITATNVNTGELSTSGFDVNAVYSFDIGEMGSLKLDYTATYLNDLTTQELPTSDPYDSVGFYSGRHGTPNPEYRHIAGVDWETPWNITAGLTWRHFASVEIEGGAQPFDAQNYLDLNGRYDVFENTSLRFGVNNVLDEEPPISSSVGAGFGNGNTFPQVYDALGRYVFMGATIDF